MVLMSKKDKDTIIRMLTYVKDELEKNGLDDEANFVTMAIHGTRKNLVTAVSKTKDLS